MWKVLGKEAMYIEIGPLWAERIVELSEEYEGDERFKELMSKAEVKHLFNGSTETHNLMIEVPKDYTPDDIQMMADMILSIAKDNMEMPFISLDDNYQKCQVVINNDEEPELLGLNRTEGYGSGKIFLPILDSLTRPGRPNKSMM
jgi:hypothetical protein